MYWSCIVSVYSPTQPFITVVVCTLNIVQVVHAYRYQLKSNLHDLTYGIAGSVNAGSRLFCFFLY
jgi:hypothetical protein